ncbi:prepilin-type N-terminal cleavage/methylation domain-containing protein [Ornithinibacillus sp. L9]|uniref:ComG operon protein 3 n=1 Tax=Ornithinibacillus caprae TaxID=2678566 RepID=A0A6N8FGF4_9BACI|nr:competence type IV pilus major pilin ComGC [Ornithinibacillus caprae]MUK87137.1 prepilin-type N-terminal cleavage/methylation domain-containing protein [Ornithinibacillus caprae]
MLKNNKGFTLIEMLIVLMIISVLIILFIPNLGDKSKSVSDKGCDALVTVVQAQVDTYLLDNGHTPVNLDELIDEGYLLADQTTCPNDEDIIYENGKASVPN